MSTFVLMYFLYFCTFFVWNWLRAVKIYLHAKFRASSSKIDRVMLNFVFGTVPVTNLPVELCAWRQLIIMSKKLNGTDPIPILRYCRHKNYVDVYQLQAVK